MRYKDLHYDMKSRPSTNGMASRRQIMDWLIEYVHLVDSGIDNYPFKMVFYGVMVGVPGLMIHYCGETPWQCYKHATDKIFGSIKLRKKFLTLYNNS